MAKTPTNIYYGNSSIENNNFGYNIKFSGNSKYLAVSSRGESNIGIVELFSHNNNSNVLNTIPLIILKGKNKNDNFGCSIDINNNGDLIVIGAHQDSNSRGYVNVYNRFNDKYSIIPTMTFWKK